MVPGTFLTSKQECRITIRTYNSSQPVYIAGYDSNSKVNYGNASVTINKVGGIGGVTTGTITGTFVKQELQKPDQSVPLTAEFSIFMKE